MTTSSSSATAPPTRPKRKRHKASATPRGPAAVAPAGLPQYVQRCREINQNGARARVIYPPSEKMTLGNPAVVQAAVTLNQTLAPAKVLGTGGVVSSSGLIVSCGVQAQLAGSSYDFSIDDPRWIQRSLLTADTARWSWYVTPKVGGSPALTLYVRPFIKVTGGSDPNLAGDMNADVQQFAINAKVHVPLLQQPDAWMASLSGTLKVAKGLVEALTGLVLAGIALGAALGIKRFRKLQGQTDQEEAPEPKVAEKV